MAHLLVVEDDKVLLGGLKMLLTKAGHSVLTADSGQMALDVLAGGPPPDIVVADLLLPGMTGLELLEIVRTYDEWEDVPFLFMTAQNMPRVNEEVSAVGNASVLYKPFEPGKLEDAVEATLEGRR